MHYLIVGCGGFFGAMARFGAYQLEGLLPPHRFPLATLLINVVGCFLAGLLLELLTRNLQLFFIVGFLGAFTTFSTFGVETIQLLRTGALGLALMNILSSVVLSLLGVWLGMKTTSGW
jgi:CrcB protein